MNGIDFLEHGGATAATPFAVRHHGELIALPDPRDRHYQWVLHALQIHYVPGTPGDIPDWQRLLVFERWCAAWGLPLEFHSAQRLAYLVDRYSAALTNDLITFANGTQLDELWRARRWRTLLDLIDRLPSHSWFSATVAKDKEHSRMLAEAIQAQRENGEDEEKTNDGPPLTSWTPVVAGLTDLTDAVRRVEHAVYAAQIGPKAGEAPKPLPRPVTELARAMKVAEYHRRKEQHEALAARVLRRK